jgi:hypothetical protein
MNKAPPLPSGAHLQDIPVLQIKMTGKRCRRVEGRNVQALTFRPTRLNPAAAQTSVALCRAGVRQARLVVSANRWRQGWRAERNEGGGPPFISGSAGPLWALVRAF